MPQDFMVSFSLALAEFSKLMHINSPPPQLDGKGGKVHWLILKIFPREKTKKVGNFGFLAIFISHIYKKYFFSWLRDLAIFRGFFFGLALPKGVRLALG